MNRPSKKIIGRASAFFFALFMALSFSPQKVQAQYGDASYQTFYDDLAPYGTWMNDPQYGYVWAPNAGRGFRPYYTNGYWAMTEYGNMWVSNYSWGWAPFHYGRWAYSDYYGWIWIPGNEWGPAWVTWRQGGGYYGWAPMGPGISIGMSFGSGYYVPDPYWTFIPCNNIYSRSFHRYYSPRRTRTVIRNTTIINNTYVDNRSRNTYVTGPRRNEVERVTGRSVETYNVSPGRSSGRANIKGKTINVYRPEVRNTNSGRGGTRAAPRTVKNMERPLKPVTNGQSNRERNVPNKQSESVKPPTNNRVQPREGGIRRDQPQVAPQRGASPKRGEIQQRPNSTVPARESRVPQNPKPDRNQNQSRLVPRKQEPKPQRAEQKRSSEASPQRKVSPQQVRQEPARTRAASPRSVEHNRNAERSATESRARGHR